MEGRLLIRGHEARAHLLRNARVDQRILQLTEHGRLTLLRLLQFIEKLGLEHFELFRFTLVAIDLFSLSSQLPVLITHSM